MILLDKRKEYKALRDQAIELGYSKKVFNFFVLQKAKRLFPIKYSWEDACLIVAKRFILLAKKEKNEKNNIS
jgi:hypothetical protein